MADTERFHTLGYRATRRYASRIDAGNAKSFAADIILRRVHDALRCPQRLPEIVVELETKCGLDLSELLSGDRMALAAFCSGGCKLGEEE